MVQLQESADTNQTKMKKLSTEQKTEVLSILKERFEKNLHRHPSIKWSLIEEKLEKNLSKLWSLYQMELTGGEPDVIDYLKETNEYVFCDCTAESPKGRRSYCYDKKALDERKEHKPTNNVLDAAKEMGVELLTETDYKNLQKLGTFDSKTSSWIQTSEEIRKLGGAIFADFRYNQVFVYHNGASSYYASRGFRALLKV